MTIWLVVLISVFSFLIGSVLGWVLAILMVAVAEVSKEREAKHE